MSQGQGFSVPEAAARIGISERLLRSLITRRAIGHCRVERRIVITEKQIDAYLESTTIRPRRVLDVSAPNPEHRHIHVVNPAC